MPGVGGSTNSPSRAQKDGLFKRRVSNSKPRENKHLYKIRAPSSKLALFIKGNMLPCEEKIGHQLLHIATYSST